MKNVTYISAGAGSGKTYTLTTKLAELIAKDKSDPEHVEPEQVILTTFTVKAANEFKEKAKAELYKRGKFDEASRLDHALMGTIDSVASSLIKKYWYTIGLSPKQGVMDDSAKATYINQSIANIPTDDDLHFFIKFRKAFNVVDSDYKPDENFWKDHLKDIVEKTISFDISDYSASMEESLKVLRMLCNGTSIHTTHEQRNDILQALRTEVECCKASGKKITTLNGVDDLKNRSRFMDDIEWFAELKRLLDGEPSVPKTATPIPLLEDAKQKADDLWGSQEVYDMQERYIHTIFRLAKEWNEQYTQYKLNKRIVDFCDIEHYMHRLLQDEEVAKEIGRTYTHLFVDEFQDCSPIQVKIFMTLADVVKKSFWVGDTKQAIYGFRASDTALTKAVADVIAKNEGKEGCKTETLKESWRSVPTLVEACNKAFVKIFEPEFGDASEQQVHLEPAMLRHPENFEKKLSERAKDPLRYLKITNRRTAKSPKLDVGDVAQYIKNVIEKENVAPSDIAVLGRSGYAINEVQDALMGIGIACDRETSLDKESKACLLMMALTTLTVNPQDDLAKAQIAYLTQDNMGLGAIIDSKLEHNSTPSAGRTPWLGHAEMIRRVNDLRQSVMYQGIGALMETLAVELDVKNIMERWPVPIEDSMADVKALIAAAKQYEERSSELALPATPSGFATFLDENDITLPATGNGVQLLTYHGAKGLEWKYVFLLLDETMEPKDVLRRELYGIHHFHPQSPTADHLFPQMSLRLLPWIFGSLKNVPETIANQLLSSKTYGNLLEQCLKESARLLYVGMTRAEEVLVLVPWLYDKEFEWLRRSGLPSAGKEIDGGDVLGIGMPFKVVEAEKPEEEESMASAPRVYHRLDYHSDVPSSAPSRVVAPSGVKGTAEQVDVVYRSEQFIKVNSAKMRGRTYSEVGDCIHNVYAAIEKLDRSEVEQLIRSHGMDDVLPDAGEIIRAWDNLQRFLQEQFGQPLAVYHERPFRSLHDDGTIVVGSMDYVYQTPQGAVLVDFKTFPQVEAITDSRSDHYAGRYAGQLDAYADALEAAGEKVAKRYIYYPVSGLLVEVGRSAEAGATAEHGGETAVDTRQDAPDSSRPDEEGMVGYGGDDDPVDLNEKNSIAMTVSGRDFKAFLDGVKRVVSVDVNQDTYESVLENIKGHLILHCDEMPSYFYSCYFWNGGMFPYMVKKDLEYIILLNAGRELILRITGDEATAGQRYTISDNMSLVPDDHGDACLWTIHFEVEKCAGASTDDINYPGRDPKTYLLRWNPAISSFTLDDYRRATTQHPGGFRFNWSVYEWEDAHQGDRFFMLRTGDDNAGIVFRGVFTSEPYEGDDWAGKGLPRHYMDMDCYEAVAAGEKPAVDIVKLERAIPGIDWRRGHSGQLLSDADADILEELWCDQ